jgi:maltokinase
MVVVAVDFPSSSESVATGHLVVIEDSRSVRYGVPCVLEEGLLRRARPGDGVSQALVDLLGSDGKDTVDGLLVESFAAPSNAVGERAVDVDQTNELVVVGDTTIVKWILHPVDSDQPAPRRLSILARSGFDGTPRLLGLARLDTPTSHALVAIITEYVPGTSDGWEWAVDDVLGWASGGRGLTRALDPVRAVGRLVADMHVALATGGEFVASATDADRWGRQATDDVDAAAIDPALEPRVRALLAPIADAVGARAVYSHGDLHIGQILRSEAGRYYVVDFDGSPMVEAGERMRPVPPARDVASLMASLDHVGRVVLHRTEGLDAEARDRVNVWIERAQAMFLEAYRATLKAAGRLDLLDESLLLPFQVQQECREYAYADRYLPHWRYVPDAALPALLNRGPR